MLLTPCVYLPQRARKWTRARFKLACSRVTNIRAASDSERVFVKAHERLQVFGHLMLLAEINSALLKLIEGK